MATKPKTILSTHDGREVSPITKASNVLFEDGQTAQDILNDRQDAMISPVIENSSSMFKVGQGDNVDYSSNVVNGAYESMVLKGKSMVNCIQEPSSQDVVLPYAFEDGQYVTINDTKESGALGVELKGQTLVNLATTAEKSLAACTQTDSGFKFNAMTEDFDHKIGFLNVAKPNTYYTYIFMSDTEFEYHTGWDATNNDGWNQPTHRAVVGLNILRVKTEANATKTSLLFRTTGNRVGNKDVYLSNFMLIEGDQSQENIPYFEGMTSCKMPILMTTGKNLFDVRTVKKGYTLASTNGLESENVKRYTSDFIYVKGLTDITITNPQRTQNIWGYDENKQPIIKVTENPVNGNFVISLPSNITYIRIPIATINQDDITDEIIQNNLVQVEAGRQISSYEPYKSSILSLPEEVVLRSLPNGVCDTFNTKTGVYTQRIGEVVLDGSLDEYWTDYMKELDTTQAFYTSYNIIGKCYDIISNSFPTITKGKMQASDIEGISTDDTSERGFVFIRIKKSRLSTQDTNGFKAWLQSNPVTVQYQLETPVITKINLPSTLKSWNTTTHIYSEIPENTLYPTLSHSNPTYPVILKPSTKYSIVANSYSNNHTNSTINFNLGGATASTVVGNRVTTITTPSTLSNELLTMSGRGNKLNNVMVIEGDVVGDEPYFEGICDCKSPILLNCGENLFDKTKVKREKYQNYNVPNGIFSISSNSNYKVTDYIRVKPNTSYTSRNLGDGAYYTFNKKPITDIFCRAGNFTVPSNAHYVVLNMSIGQDEDAVGLQEVPSSSLHEPYKSNTTTFDQKDGKTIVLCSLPNGVCDTLNVETGEYVQRIAQYTLTGNETNAWNISNNSSGELAYITVANIIPEVKGTEGLIGNLISDTFHNDNPYHVIRHERCIGAYQTHIRIKIPEIELSVNSYKDYFRNNPTTIQYELATPIVSTIDVQGFPYAYENGHVQLSSGSIEQSLTPKVEYSVATNRNGQIRSNQKMVERHQKQLDQLQAIILANLVNSQYNQTLTTLKYELSRV